MCGIAGFVAAGNAVGDLGATADAMARRIAHRGPDACGHWVDADAGVALGHRRLSIVDLSEAGAQPMAAPSGRYMLSFNGEIYNHMALREQLDGVAWRGHSDTETLLVAIDRWGLTRTLERLVGMFAFALWDRETRGLTLVRDRMGEKPLYYGWARGGFVFSSELAPLGAFPGFDARIDPESVALYLSQRCVPAPRSIFAGIQKLEPGHLVTLAWRATETVSRPYWSLAGELERPAFEGSPDEAVDELERRLSEAVRGQMMADVPLGAFLSGGIDSSTIVALMQAQSNRPIRSFSIGFMSATHDEAPFAAAIANHLGTDHTELTVTEEDALAIIPDLPTIWDEPFADSSQIPTALLARLAREHVTVALSGDGGDELFCGYSRHRAGQQLERLPMKPWLARALELVPHRALGPIFSAVRGRDIATLSAERHAGLIDALRGHDRIERYRNMRFRPSIAERLMGRTPPASGPYVPAGLDYLTAVSFADTQDYLPDDILVKVDRAAMAASLETRVPFLDHRVVEFAFSLNSSLKIRDGQTKWPVRRLLERHVPLSLTDRPKQGFEVPLAEWLRGRLRPWAESLLLDPAQDRLLDQREVVLLWREHIAGRRDWSTTLWTVLMYRAWHRALPGWVQRG